MSRIGRAPITIPAGVDVTITGANIAVKGPKGSLAMDVHPNMQVTIEDRVMTVARPNDSGPNRSLHGLTRTLLSNMVTGVTTGFEKKLEIQGVGYRASKKGADLEILVGYSHPVVVTPPENIEFEVPVPTQIVVKGIDKQRVGQVAADIRSIRRPEPYKGKASGTRAKGAAKSASGRSEDETVGERRGLKKQATDPRGARARARCAAPPSAPYRFRSTRPSGRR
jgi:large subunit ribosomal protein L6